MEELLPAAPVSLAIACALSAFAAALQGVIGFGFAILTVPVLSLLDPALAPVPQLLIMWVMTFGMFMRERHAVDLRGVGWILLGRLPGAGLGILLLKLADQRLLDMLLAGMVLTAVFILASGVKVQRTKITELSAGVASGTFSIVSSIGGPPLALLYREEKGPTIRASLAAIFSIGLLITVGARLAAGEIGMRDLHVAAFLLPALVLGLYLSRFLTTKFEGRPMRIGILVVASIASVGLITRAILGGGGA